MKKIVIINHYGITPEMPGATKHFDLASFFSKKNEYKVEFWMCGYNHQTGKNENTLKGFKFQYKKNYEFLQIIKIKSTPYKNSLILRQLNHIFFDFITAIKILFSKDIACIIISVPPISNFNIWVTKIKKIKLILDVEDLWPLFLQDMGMNKKLVINYMEKSANYAYNASDAIDAVSEGMVNFIKGKIKNKNKTIWLAPLGVNLQQYNLAKTSNYFSKYEWCNDLKILYIGALGKANGIEDVLKTIKELNLKKEDKISFIFIGDGNNKNNLISLKNKLKLRNVYFEESIPSIKVPEYLINADICLTNLCKVESFKLVRPNKLFQYMAAKAPIISGIWGEAKEIIEESKAGIYVDFTDYKEAAKQINMFINDMETLNKCRKNGYSYICKNGDREKIFQEFYINTLKIINI